MASRCGSSTVSSSSGGPALPSGRLLPRLVYSGSGGSTRRRSPGAARRASPTSSTAVSTAFIAPPDIVAASRAGATMIEMLTGLALLTTYVSICSVAARGRRGRGRARPRVDCRPGAHVPVLPEGPQERDQARQLTGSTSRTVRATSLPLHHVVDARRRRSAASCASPSGRVSSTASRRRSLLHQVVTRPRWRGGWRVALYLDTSDQSQQEALGASSRASRGPAGDARAAHRRDGVKTVLIRYESNGTRKRVEVPGIMSSRSRRDEPDDGRGPRVTNRSIRWLLTPDRQGRRASITTLTTVSPSTTPARTALPRFARQG